MVLGVLLLYSIFFPLNDSYSFRFRSGLRIIDTEPSDVTVWALNTFMLQFCAIYLLSWPIKIWSDFAWRDGTQVYFAFHNQLFSRFAHQEWIEVLAWNDSVLSKIITYFTLFEELAFPLLVWFKPFRNSLVYAGLVLHVGLAVVLEAVVVFNLVSCAGLLLFLGPLPRFLSLNVPTHRILKT